MGRVALAIEERVLPGTQARWEFIPLRELPARGFASAAAFAQEMESRYPPQRVRAGGGERLAEGVVFTGDPEKAREVLTVLFVGAAIPIGNTES